MSRKRLAFYQMLGMFMLFGWIAYCLCMPSQWVLTLPMFIWGVGSLATMLLCDVRLTRMQRDSAAKDKCKVVSLDPAAKCGWASHLSTNGVAEDGEQPG